VVVVAVVVVRVLRVPLLDMAARRFSDSALR
jgi:hypothetical protein